MDEQIGSLIFDMTKGPIRIIARGIGIKRM
jgi:hypothetical protein